MTATMITITQRLLDIFCRHRLSTSSGPEEPWQVGQQILGAPAKLIRYCFIERMLESRWWRYGPDVLPPLDMRQPEAFLDVFAEAAEAVTPMSLPILTGEEMIVAAQP